MNSAVTQDYWDKAYKNLPLVYDPDRIEFRDLFNRYLLPGGTCFEVGCYPGNFLIYMGKNFGYEVSGIDKTYLVKNQLPMYLAEHGIKIGNLYYGDFLEFEFDQTYDVVCSFGFIEHFFNFKDIIKKHIELVKPTGTLIIACPNFSGLQYFFRRLVDSENLQHHVMKAMDLPVWGEILNDNGMDILLQGYYRTADFWVDPMKRGFLASKAIEVIQGLTGAIDKKINWPNSWLSPYMISISQKRPRR